MKQLKKFDDGPLVLCAIYDVMHHLEAATGGFLHMLPRSIGLMNRLLLVTCQRLRAVSFSGLSSF